MYLVQGPVYGWGWGEGAEGGDVLDRSQHRSSVDMIHLGQVSKPDSPHYMNEDQRPSFAWNSRLTRYKPVSTPPCHIENMHTLI